MYDKNLVTRERLEALKPLRDKHRDAAFAEAAKVIGEEGAQMLKYLYDGYDERMYLWIAGLWEPTAGAFYFSNSGRDTEGFLPDIESTIQAMTFLDSSGLTAAKYPKIGEVMHTPIARYAESLQDEDGYFYHPQWGKNISVSRRGRDLGWATSAIKSYGGVAKYPTPLEKKADGASLLPEHLQSIENFRAYLASLDLTNQSYSVGNLISAQMAQIKAAGEEFVDTVDKWYVENQNPENGTWSATVDYHATNGLMKVCLAYSQMGREIPLPEQAMESAFKVTLSDLPSGGITSFYNPWITMQMIIGNLQKYGNADKADQLRARLIANAPMMIKQTAEKIKPFKRDDGSYSYNPAGSCGTSQGAPVSYAKMPEGDINGNCLASTGLVRNLCSTLSVKPVTFFCKEDGELFFELIENSFGAKKIYPKPNVKNLL